MTLKSFKISELEPPHAISGFIPFRAVKVFHSLKSHPIISLEVCAFFPLTYLTDAQQGDQFPVFTIATTIDRNILLPYFPDADVVYSRTLNKLHSEVFQSRKWGTVFIPPLKTTHSGRER